jgi:hypothetical protein
MVAIGLTAAAAQVAVPYAAPLAAPERRGQVAGTVTGGVILDILLSRTASGALAGPRAGGGCSPQPPPRWRSARGAHGCGSPVDDAEKYPRGTLTLVAATVHLVRAEQVLRSRMLLGFFGFSAMWTSLTFVLAGTYHF